MNNELTELVEQIKQATDYQANKKILHEQNQSDLHIVYNGGLFKITPELIGFVSAWPREQMFIADSYGNPIEVKRQEFFDIAVEHYQIVMNRWHMEHQKLERTRKI